MKVLVTGAAGFIGSHLSLRLLARGDQVVGVDNLNDYYDVNIKKAHLKQFIDHPAFEFMQMDIADRDGMAQLFASQQFDAVMNLAAQAGVRYSIENPHAYIDANIVGFCNLLEGCRHSQVAHLVFASSSSVYGGNTKLPFSEHDNVDHPVSLYAATKKSNELMAHTYAHLYHLACTGLRFFTVYGPWGRPDMALFLFTKGIIEGKPINIFNHGNMVRDFTYVDDIVEGVLRVIDHPPTSNPDWNGDTPDPASSNAPYRIFNIGSNRPLPLMDYVTAIEEAVGKKAIINKMAMQAGDVFETYADMHELEKAMDFCPAMPIKEGIANAVAWYRDYFKV